MQCKLNFPRKFPIKLQLELLKILDLLEIPNCSFGEVTSEFDLSQNQVFLRNIFTIENSITEIVYSEAQENFICAGNALGKFKIFDTSKQNSQALIDIPVHQKSINSISCNKFLPFLYLTTGDDGKINLVDTKA